MRIALLQGRFRYAETGLLDRTHMRFFTLETIREMMSQAGLVVVETKRVVMPLFHSEIGVERSDVNHKTLDELHADPEVETYQFVMKSVRDNGDLAVVQLADKVQELTDRMHNQRMRIALIRKALRDNRILDEHLNEHKRYIEALEGHVSGLENNIAILNEGFQASEARYQALLAAGPPAGLTSRAKGVYRRMFRGTKSGG
jgi:hypothetical protein